LRAQEKGLELLLEFEQDVPEYVVSDPVRLRQILVNLMGNAVKFTETGTVRLVVQFDQPARKLVFHVIDTGIGITPNLREALFQPFNQGDTSQTRKYGGTGLGLTISRRLAQMLGGNITVESNPGYGSTFTAAVDAGPLLVSNVTVRTNRVAQDSEESRPPQRHLNCRVLVVDDREDIRMLASYFVTEAGGRVVATCDGLEAIAAVHEAQNVADPFDIILMDMQMPNLDGRETTALLRESSFRQPIIAITADAMQGDREKTLMAGCDGYLSKPIEREELISMIALYTQDLSLEEIENRRRTVPEGQRPIPDRERHESAEQGTRLPVEPAPVPQDSGILSDRLTEETPKVLIVDDWPDTSRSMAELLNMSGFLARTCETGSAAVETYLDWQPDAVLMDLGLPDMDGCEAVRRMRQCAPLRETFFVAVSGRDDEADIRRARKAGFDQYLIKPADINQVIRALQTRLQPAAAVAGWSSVPIRTRA
jgi:CheY-like chemotaxis protein